MRPEFWSDETLGALPDAARLFYIGLWNVADDAGWLEWRPTRLGALLYPYRTARRREADIAAWSVLLIADGRLRLEECGCAWIPTLPRHQRVTGKQSFQYRDSHMNKHRLLTDKRAALSDSPVTEGNGREGNVLPGFKEKLAAAGGKAP